MITSFADLCTIVFVLVDDLYRQVVAPHDRRPGPRAAFADSEVITVTLVAELLGEDIEATFLAWVREHHLALFPRLPERSRFNRRRRQLPEATNRIRGALMERVLGRLEPEEADLCVIDSLPAPVVGFPHARGSHRWLGEASYGYVASKHLTIYGFKLHLLITHSGLILDFVLAPAHVADGRVTEQLLADKARLTVLGDKAYLNAPLQAWLAAHNDLTLLTPKRDNQRQQQPALLTKAITHFRQVIETVNSQLTHQFGVERNWAKSMFGLGARLQAKLAAHTLGLYLNCWFGRPLLALADLTNI
jgi:Transposase DDE domain